jgi:hypothetical protein
MSRIARVSLISPPLRIIWGYVRVGLDVVVGKEEERLCNSGDRRAQGSSAITFGLMIHKAGQWNKA